MTNMPKEKLRKVLNRCTQAMPYVDHWTESVGPPTFAADAGRSVLSLYRTVVYIVTIFRRKANLCLFEIYFWGCCPSQWSYCS